MRAFIRISAVIGLLTSGSTVLASPPDVSAPQPAAFQPGGLQPPITAPAPSNGATPGNAPVSFWDQCLMTGNWGGVRDDWQNHGVTFAASWTGEIFGNPSGGMRRGLISDGLLDAQLDVDLGHLTNLPAFDDTLIQAYALYIYGPNLSASYVGDFSTTSNIAGYNTLRLQELWIQKQFWNKRVSVKAGNIAVDLEYFQCASGALFLSGTFGAFPFVANNIPDAPLYPLASPGVRLQFLPTANSYVMAGGFGLDNGSNPKTNNQNGTRFALNAASGMLVMTEAGYLLNQGKNDHGLQGTYRIGSWLDTGNSTTFASQANFGSGAGSLQGAAPDFGVYGIMDQQICACGNANTTMFVRCGGAPSNTSMVDWYVEGGFNFTGYLPGRGTDVAGLAIGRSHISHDFSNAEVLEGDAPSTAETVIEGTYKVQLNPWWYVQPDVQYIITPGGEQDSHNATVLGLRSGLTF